MSTIYFADSQKKKEVKIRHHFELHVKYAHYILQMAKRDIYWK